MALTEQEKREFAERFKAELEAKYPKTVREPEPPPAPNPVAEREAELERLRMEVLDEFHRANNFIRHIDSKGHEQWFSPEEYDERRKRRRKKKEANETTHRTSAFQRAAVIVVGLVLAAIVGWMMRP